jgi:hypothetical protein
MKRILIDKNLVSKDGNRCFTYLEVPDNEDQPSVLEGIITQERLALELTVAPIEGVMGYRLVEEELLPTGEIEVIQEYILFPDIAYSLFKVFEKWDQEM